MKAVKISKLGLCCLALLTLYGEVCFADSDHASIPDTFVPLKNTVSPEKENAIDKLSSMFANDWLDDSNASPSVSPEESDQPASPQIYRKALSADQGELQSKPPHLKIAILIDDLGYNRQGMESALSLPRNVALAILPMTPFASQTAKIANHQKRIIILHTPMENERELKLGPGGLYVKMDEVQLKKALTKDIDSLPGIQGINNHMGSLLTANQHSMDWVMEVLKKRSLFFIDSLTSPQSVAKQTAQHYGLRTASRDIFLDNIRVEKAIDRQFSRLIAVAKRNGIALAIGHPYPETMAYLKKRLTKLHNEGIELVPLTAVLHKKESMQ